MELYITILLIIKLFFISVNRFWRVYAYYKLQLDVINCLMPLMIFPDGSLNETRLCRVLVTKTASVFCLQKFGMQDTGFWIKKFDNPGPIINEA
jgi:hypothetical protein